MAIRAPQIKSVETAVRLYYAYPQMATKQITELFGSIGHDRVNGLKQMAHELTRERGGVLKNETCVRTADAYEAWGLDITELERNLQKLRKLGMLESCKDAT